MDENSLSEINKRISEQKQRQVKEQKLESDLERIARSMITAMKLNIEHRDGKHGERAKDALELKKELAKALENVGKSIKDASDQDAKNLKSFLSSLEGFQQAIRDDKTIDKEQFTDTLSGLLAVSDSMTDTSAKLQGAVKDFGMNIAFLSEIPEQLSKHLKELNDNSDVVEAINNIEVKPEVNVTTPEVEVDTKALEAVIEDKLEQLAVALSVIQDEKPEIDLTAVEIGLERVRSQIENIIFPVPQYPTTIEVFSARKSEASNGADNVTVGATDTAVLSANNDRKAFILTNDSDEEIYLAYGVAAEMNKGIRLNAKGGVVREELYKGAVNAICASGSKNLAIVEV